MKFKLLLLFYFAAFFPRLFSQTPDHERYIERFKSIAIAEMERCGIPASIKLAQGILESGVGKSELATNANNHFGIKCGSGWTGETYFLVDDDRDTDGNLIKSCFRVFTTPEQSFIAHSEFLLDPKKQSRYGVLFTYDRLAYQQWATGLKDAGYATNPKYPELLTSLIEKNDLHRFDFMTLKDLDPKFVQNYEEQRAQIQSGQVSPNQFLYFNRLKIAFAQQDETPNDIALRFGISVGKILSYNDLDGFVVFNNNEKVYLQRKKCRYKGGLREHTVREGETMHAISQLYGIRLKKLYQKNRMKSGTQPKTGEKIALYKKTKNTPQVYAPNETPPPPPTKPTPLPPTTTTTPPDEDGRLPEIVAPTPPPTPDPNRPTHVVEKGDTLFSIARKYGVSVEQLKQLNQLTDNVLRIGQTLIIR